MKHLVLLGGEFVHVHLLVRLAQHARQVPLPFRVTLIAPHPQLLEAAMLPALVAGHKTAEQCSVALHSLLHASGVNYVQGGVCHVDLARKVVVVGRGEPALSFGYDALSVDTEPVMDRDLMERTIPGAREHALFLRPGSAFPALWNRLLELAARQPLRIAVIGAETAGVELAFALIERLPQCSVTLVCGGVTPAANHPEAVQQRVLRRLKDCGITVLPQTCSAIAAGHIVLDQVTHLACDAPVLTLAAQTAPWLASSGLALNELGLIAVNEFQQSTSHPQVFAARGVAGPGAGLDVVHAASNLAMNLFAALSGLGLQAYKPRATGLNFVSCGGRYAMASWGRCSFEGRWVAYWKDWASRRLMARIKARP